MEVSKAASNFVKRAGSIRSANCSTSSHLIIHHFQIFSIRSNYIAKLSEREWYEVGGNRCFVLCLNVSAIQGPAMSLLTGIPPPADRGSYFLSTYTLLLTVGCSLFV